MKGQVVKLLSEQDIKSIRTMLEEGRFQKNESSGAETRPCESKPEEKPDELAKLMPPGFSEWPDYVKQCWRQEQEVQRRYSKDDKQGLQIKRYLEFFERVPWKRAEVIDIDIARARRILDKEHYGMEEVKSTIMEILAVQKLKEEHLGPVLLLLGPPGIGKTSLAKSVAHAVGRPFTKISLGGMADEVTLKGADRAYTNAFPGAIIRALSNCGSSAPVMLLDEIDKLPLPSNKGDCGSIFLDILDSNRNTFVDNYLQVPVDLSDVFFICTANEEDSIPKPLLDRMEIIRLRGYTDEEKLQIAKRHIIPQVLQESGLDRLNYSFSDDAVEILVEACTDNKGVRELERLVVSVCRRAALLFLENEMDNTLITEAFISEQNILKKFGTVRERRIGFCLEK